MTNNRVGSHNGGRQSSRRKSSFWVWLAVPLGSAGGGALWFGVVPGVHLPPLGTGAVLALAAFWGLVWLGRVRAARRLTAAMDAYAEREMEQALQWSRPKKTFSRRELHARSHSQAR
jgi:hypothetical protein